MWGFQEMTSSQQVTRTLDQGQQGLRMRDSAVEPQPQVLLSILSSRLQYRSACALAIGPLKDPPHITEDSYLPPVWSSQETEAREPPRMSNRHLTRNVSKACPLSSSLTALLTHPNTPHTADSAKFIQTALCRVACGARPHRLCCAHLTSTVFSTLSTPGTTRHAQALTPQELPVR